MNSTSWRIHKVFRQKINGFTLIELLVVIAIISLLVSILLPSLVKAKKLAKITMCSANLKYLGISLVLYADENNQSFPNTGKFGTWWYSADGEYGGFRSNAGSFVRLIYPNYVTSRTVLYCPLDPVRSAERYWVSDDQPNYGPSLEYNGISYAYSACYGTDGDLGHMALATRCRTLSDPVGALMSDQEGWSESLPWYWPHDAEISYGYITSVSSVNILFSDGHVESLKIEPLWQLFYEAVLSGT